MISLSAQTCQCVAHGEVERPPGNDIEPFDVMLLSHHFGAGETQFPNSNHAQSHMRSNSLVTRTAAVYGSPEGGIGVDCGSGARRADAIGLATYPGVSG